MRDSPKTGALRLQRAHLHQMQETKASRVLQEPLLPVLSRGAVWQ